MTDEETSAGRYTTDQTIKAVGLGVVGLICLATGTVAVLVRPGSEGPSSDVFVVMGGLIVLVGVGLLAGSVTAWRHRRRAPSAREAAIARARVEYGYGVAGLAIGLAAAVWALLVAVRPEFGSEALFAGLPLGLFVPIGYLVMVRTRRRLRDLRRLAALPPGAGTTLPVTGVVMRPDETVLYLDAEGGRIAVHLSVLQDLSTLPAPGGTVEVLGDPSPGGTVLVRPADGPVLWPRTDLSLFGQAGHATGA